MNLAHATPPTVRRSLAEGLLTCPRFRMEESERLAFGQAFHAFIASYWRHLQAIGEETDMSGWLPLAKDAWARTPGLLQSRFAEFMDLCERFAATHLGELDTLVAVEEPMALNLGWVVLVCTPDRIDRVDGGDPDEDATWERITDYKSEMGEMEHAFQLSWYAQMRFLTRPSLERIDVVLDLVRWGLTDDPLTIERGDLDAWWDTVLQGLRRRLEGSAEPPRGGPACVGCALRRTCASALTTAVAIPETDDEADQLLADHRRADAAAGARWEALKMYYAGRSPRVVNGEEIGFLQSRDESFELLVGPRAMRLFAAMNLMDQDALLQVAPIRNKGLQNRLIELGVARRYRKPGEFKTRQAEPEAKCRRRERRLAAAQEGDGDSE
jgi:PD-(D/E)XK nuclease superfamily